MKWILLCTALLGGWFTLPGAAEACTCMEPDIGRSYDYADHVVHVRIERALGGTRLERRFLARLVDDDFKGCLRAGQRVIVQTPADSAACGVTLRPRRAYLLHAKRERGAALVSLRVGSCQGNVEFAALTQDDRAFLQSRFVCCGGDCACTDGTDPVNCLVDPCQVSSCGVPDAECRANYCGGCNAEWYDATGAIVCGDDDGCDDDPARSYVSRDPAQCAAIRFRCDEGNRPFFDDCGCGCEPLPACARGGCSGQLCLEEGDDRVTTCEWREEYACYDRATCERQGDGSCGWTPTDELEACLDTRR
jgi:hypothetical protein